MSVLGPRPTPRDLRAASRLTEVHRPRARQAVDVVGAPAYDPGCVKTRSDLVVMPCGARIFAFIRSPCAHTPQKSWCAFTARSFHTAWTRSCRSASPTAVKCKPNGHRQFDGFLGSTISKFGLNVSKSENNSSTFSACPATLIWPD